jgi:hypothetical protein
LRLKGVLCTRQKICLYNHSFKNGIDNSASRCHFKILFSQFTYCAGILVQSMWVRNRVGKGLLYRPASAGILGQSMGARNREGIGLSYRPARLHRLAESIPFESIPGLLKNLKIPFLYSKMNTDRNSVPKDLKKKNRLALLKTYLPNDQNVAFCWCQSCELRKN